MIFYFSATGNTKWAAEQLAAATGEQLYSISELIRADHYVFHLQETERIGFCFPVHGWRPPMPVCDFLTRIKIANATGHFCFALCTAGDTIGETMRILQQDLAVAGLHAEGLYSLFWRNQSLRIKGNRGKYRECNYLKYHYLAFSCHYGD